MIYINNFIVSRRKKEFGLYGILGLEKRHVSRVLVWENFITLGLGVVCGGVIALFSAGCSFLILLKMIRAAAGSVFSISPVAYIITFFLFSAVFVMTSLLNLRQVRLSNPIQLISSEKRGEKDSKLMIPLTVIGFIFLIAAYYFAWSINSPGTALGVFFLLAILVHPCDQYPVHVRQHRNAAGTARQQKSILPAAQLHRDRRHVSAHATERQVARHHLHTLHDAHRNNLRHAVALF